MTTPLQPNNIVLYADDDHDDLELVKEALEHYSSRLEVKTVTDGSAAISYLENLPEEAPLPCLIILDINMPVLDGKQTLVKLRSMDRYINIPVVLFTTSSLPLDKNFARNYNAGFITKPIGIRQMEIIADQFIEHCAEEVRRNIRRQIQ